MRSPLLVLGVARTVESHPHSVGTLRAGAPRRRGGWEARVRGDDVCARAPAEAAAVPFPALRRHGYF